MRNSKRWVGSGAEFKSLGNKPGDTCSLVSFKSKEKNLIDKNLFRE